MRSASQLIQKNLALGKSKGCYCAPCFMVIGKNDALLTEN